MQFARRIFFACVALGACAGAPDASPPDPATAPLSAAAQARASASVGISAAPGASCALACFDVQSSKDISFVAVDASSCNDTPAGLSLYTVDASGGKIPVNITPAVHGNGKSCPDIPPDALKFDDLSGRHLVVCATGAQRADVFVKAGKTCAMQSFEIDVEEQCSPDTPDWLRDMGPGSFVTSSDVAVDPGGNVLFAGGGGVAKLDASGEVLWTFELGERVASDPSGNVILAGTYSTTVRLTDVFVAKLDRDGEPIWGKSFGTPAAESARSVAVDTGGNIALAISGMGTLKLAPDGELLWTKTFWGAVAFDAAGNLAITGEFTGAIDVGSGSVESTGGSDAFIVKLDPEGNPLWSHFLGDVTPGSQVGTSVAFDATGNALIVGEFYSSIRLFGIDYLTPPSTASSTKAAYIAKIDPYARPLWARVRWHTEDMLDIAADSASNVYVTGGDVGEVRPFRYNFVEMLDASGVTQWRLATSTSEWPGHGRGDSIAFDTCDNFYWSLVWSSGPPDDTTRLQLAKLDR